MVDCSSFLCIEMVFFRFEFSIHVQNRTLLYENLANFFSRLCAFFIVKYRSRTEIASMILQAVITGATKTKIMYKAYLSYTLVKEYVEFLQENDLIKYEKPTKQYKITERGLKFLRSCDQIIDLLSSKNNGKKILI